MPRSAKILFPTVTISVNLYAIKTEAWERGLSFNVVFEKNVFVRRVRCLALLEFLYAFPSPYTLGRQGNAKDDDGDISIHTYIPTYICKH
jgi:hypothetical protein